MLIQLILAPKGRTVTNLTSRQPPLLMEVTGWTGTQPMIFIRVHPLPPQSRDRDEAESIRLAQVAPYSALASDFDHTRVGSKSDGLWRKLETAGPARLGRRAVA